MSTFRFPLQRVLSWRETELSIEEAGLERLRAEQRALRSELEELTSNEEKELELIQFARSLRGGDLASIAGTRKWVAQERQRLQSQIAECIRNIEVKTAALMEARRKVRLLERLKERRRVSWVQDENRALEDLASDSALGSWRRSEDRNTAA